jgi:serine/threonine-protein kinase HipA
MSASGALGFRYDDAYLSQDVPTPLSMSMPTDAREHKNRVVLPFLQGLLPDNAQALSSIATTFGVSAASPFALLEHVGKDVAGALQFVKTGEPAPDAVAPRTAVAELSEPDIEKLLRDAIEEYRDGTPIARRERRFSLAGAQPKIALHELGDGGWGVPQDATPTTHILKPTTGELRRVDVVEQIAMSAGSELGLRVAESHLTTFGDIRTFVSTRYDRIRRNGVWRRLHQEDLCQALSVPPSKKYQRRDGGPGIAAVGGLLEAVPLLGDRRSVALDFFAGFVFNAVIAGTDAHAKNYSLMLDGESVRLAPLYDLASYAASRADGESIQLAMNVNGKYRLDSLTTDDFVRAGAKLRLSRVEALDTVDRLRSDTLGAFERARGAFGEHGSDAAAMADQIVAGVAGLPLVR